MTSKQNTPARAGRERTCTQCGATYRSPRNSSRFCSPACRKKANRGTAPTGGPRAGPANWSVISKALFKVGYVGRIGPISDRKTDGPIYALTVPQEHALDELSFRFNRNGWGHITRDEFAAALRKDGIHGFNSRDPSAAERKRRSDIRRQRIRRAA